MPEPAYLEPAIAVCGQLKPDDLEGVAARGFRAIVNNRPDGEAWLGQPSAASLDEAAAAAGLQSHHIAFTMPSLKAEDARRLEDAIARAGGPVLIFCASGFRSALLWAIMRAAQGVPVDDLLTSAIAAGQPLDKHRETIERLSKEIRAR
jgi:uncharacterized protein (TIGR01244 family)